MTSPIRADANMSLLEDERLSPIKIPNSDIIDHTNHVEMQKGLSPTSLLGKHPHGLTAKHGAKSGRDHHTSLTNTPLTRKADLKPLSGMKRAPLTSPRRNVNTNLDSLRKSKANIDSRLMKLRSDNSPADKENRRHDSSFSKYILSSPGFQNSSPTKKHSLEAGEHTPRKISKVVTNADTDLSSHSIRVDEVFNKEDLVGQISAENSPHKTNKPQILDEYSDSEVESYPAESQTNYKLNRPIEELTQQSRILKINESGNYITPQRFTEPVAKSPQPDQQTRLSKTLPLSDEKNPKSMTSPTKHLASEPIVIDDDQDDDDAKPLNDENEPTINFLMSPNSKPVFSLDHIKKIKNDHYAEVKSLEAVISNKNQEILNFSQELNATNSKFLEYDQVIKELKAAKKMLIDNEELLQVQLKHNERELASATKRLKIKSNQLALTEEKFKASENQLNELTRSYEETSKLFERLQKELEDHQLKFNEFSRVKQEKEAEISLLKENEQCLKTELDIAKDENQSSSERIEELNKEMGDLKEIVSTQEDLLNRWEQELKEDKKQREEQDLRKDSEINSLMEENEKLRSTIGQLEVAIKEDEFSKLEKQKLEDELKGAQLQLKESEETNSSLKDQLQKLKTDYEESQLLIVECNQTIDSLKTSNNEKDEIIRGDTKGMSELTEKINQLKQTIVENEKHMKASNDGDDADVELLKKQIEEYKKQNDENRARTNAKIHEVAEQLYKEYSKKHELKVSQLKNTFQKQLDALKIEKNSHRRDVESLQKKLELVNMEKEQLLKLTRGKPLLAAKSTKKSRN